jgi:hypothetical protein
LFLFLSLAEGHACWLLLQALFIKSSHIDSSLLLLPSPLCSEHPAPSAMCPFQFLVYYSVFYFFLWGTGQSVQRAMLAYPRGGCGNTVCCLFAHLLVHVSQADLEPVSQLLKLAKKVFLLALTLILFDTCPPTWEHIRPLRHFIMTTRDN